MGKCRQVKCDELVKALRSELYISIKSGDLQLQAAIDRGIVNALARVGFDKRRVREWLDKVNMEWSRRAELVERLDSAVMSVLKAERELLRALGFEGATHDA